MNIYTDEVLLAVWQKAEQVDGNDPRVWRKDFAGALLGNLDCNARFVT